MGEETRAERRGQIVMWLAAGIAAAAVAIGVGELVGGLLGGTSIIAAVGALVISLQPPGGKDLMVALFGTNDKLALEVMTGIGGTLVGGLLGLIARRDMRGALAGVVAFGVFALWLLIQDPLVSPLAAALTVVTAVGAGATMLVWLASGIARAATPSPVTSSPASVSLGRRSFLALAGTFVAVGGVLAVIGRLVGSQLATGAPAGAVVGIPSPGTTVPPLPAGADFSTDPALEGLSPIVVPNADFYRIDTRLSTPRIDAATWKLRVHGKVDRELTLTYADLLAMPLAERYVTIACVSNEVGGSLVGNAKWTGTSLMAVLDQAGVQAGATQVVGRSFDGWTCGFPTDHLSGAGREAMIVVAMNDEPLPAQHGFPARLIVPGLYGYVSATKWLTEIELTTLEAFDAYWVPLGWAKQAPILTQSRIDRPVYGAFVDAGPFTVGGVAWAPTRGISRVEVQLDDGEWQACELSQPLSSYTWVQWRATLDVAAGPHRLTVRATDGTGATQTPERTSPAPSGARGWHQVAFSAG
jgi:DMSO/TMAO reductase YedYZ molybdopterin-dependent catalytic subunit